MKRLICTTLLLFVIAVQFAMGQSYYTLKVGDTKTLYVNAHPRLNHYVSNYYWFMPGICVADVSGGSRSDSYCTIRANTSTKIAAGNRVEVQCTWYQKEKGAITETFGGTVYFYITVTENGSSTSGGSAVINVIESNPIEGQIDVDVNTKITLKFNQAVSYVPSNSVSQWERLETDDGKKIYVNSEFTSKINADGTSEGSVVMTPQQTLLPNTHYTFVMPSGCIKNKAEEPNSNEYRLSFTTGKEQDATNVCTIQEEKHANVIYNLNGQRLNTPRKGINIIDGKKIICK